MRDVCKFCACFFEAQKLTKQDTTNNLLFLHIMITEELKKRVADFVEMEQRFGSMQLITSEYVARCMQIAEEDAVEALETLKK